LKYRITLKFVLKYRITLLQGNLGSWVVISYLGSRPRASAEHLE
jgi:hypothetical protein